MVGQRYVKMLSCHPYFEVTALTGLSSVGKKYNEVVRSASEINAGSRFRRRREKQNTVGDLIVQPTRPEFLDVDLVFSPLPTEAARTLESRFAKRGLKVITDASPHRMEPDVPLIVPEVNPDHLSLIDWQRRSRSWGEGFLVATPNCTVAGLALVLKPLDELVGIRKAIVATLQALSGAGYPGVPSLDIVDNVIPYIKDEEEKVAQEALKILGTANNHGVHPSQMEVSAMCHRVATTDGHLESVYIETKESISLERVKEALRIFSGIPQKLRLPTAPTRPIIVTEADDRPQVRLDRDAGSVPGMGVTVGRIRKGLDSRSLRLTLLSHNTVRGAAGSTILTAELMESQGLLD